jgi:hypothetical protein
MQAIISTRIYAGHEAGYREAQRVGFAAIKKIEEAFQDRDSWAGRFTATLNHITEDYDIYEDCRGEYDDAHKKTQELAIQAAKGHALGIIKAQGRDDETAQLILAAADVPDSGGGH